MWVLVHGDLGMWRWLGELEGFSNQRVGHSSKEQVSHVETRGVLIGASGNPLVLETSPLRRDAWKPTQGFRLGPRGPVWFNLLSLGTSFCLSEWRSLLSLCQISPVGPGWPKLLGWPQGPWRFLLICRVVANGMGRVSLERAGPVLRCGSRGPSLEDVWARAVGTEV